MKFVTPKRGLHAALHRSLLGLVMTSVLGIGISVAEDNAAPYQSTFDDYKGIAADAQTARTLPEPSTVEEAQQSTHGHSEHPHQHTEGGAHAH